ncbi:hypothetical protein Rsub_02575 [Raphidocelis subcapitata]|uniref:CNNM transmembrane domain-containing protein n=1 Tax=Raphidocelis subcapitata TaxID=307507 RepID=A0A2V0NQG8_9CHLO|nr:hypothetical protein Rsub_02575 [Raphidocelis subcapitata]|eukprot:GBF89871.1 hypothetical protein Rsub_02575 [Raphidocelis subcapitata]
MDTPLGPLYVAGVLSCSACSALLSGLTLGLLQLDPLQLQAQQRSGDVKQAARAARLLPLTARTHQALCAIVLCNAAVSAALPLCLDRLLNPLAAILISSTAVVVFSEIIPQAIFSRFAIQVMAFFAPLLHVILWLFSPAAFPLALLLDAALGPPGSDTLFERGELRAVIALHAQEGDDAPLSLHEMAIISGAMELSATPASEAMAPLSEAPALDVAAPLDLELVARALASGAQHLLVCRGGPEGGGGGGGGDGDGGGGRGGPAAASVVGAVAARDVLALWAASQRAPSAPASGEGEALLAAAAAVAAATHAPCVGDLPLLQLPRIAASTPLQKVLELFKEHPDGLQAALVVAGPPQPVDGSPCGDDASRRSRLAAAAEACSPEAVALDLPKDQRAASGLPSPRSAAAAAEAAAGGCWRLRRRRAYKASGVANGSGAAAAAERMQQQDGGAAGSDGSAAAPSTCTVWSARSLNGGGTPRALASFTTLGGSFSADHSRDHNAAAAAAAHQQQPATLFLNPLFSASGRSWRSVASAASSRAPSAATTPHGSRTGGGGGGGARASLEWPAPSLAAAWPRQVRPPSPPPLPGTDGGAGRGPVPLPPRTSLVGWADRISEAQQEQEEESAAPSPAKQQQQGQQQGCASPAVEGEVVGVITLQDVLTALVGFEVQREPPKSVTGLLSAAASPTPAARAPAPPAPAAAPAPRPPSAPGRPPLLHLPSRGGLSDLGSAPPSPGLGAPVVAISGSAGGGGGIALGGISSLGGAAAAVQRHLHRAASRRAPSLDLPSPRLLSRGLATPRRAALTHGGEAAPRVQLLSALARPGSEAAMAAGDEVVVQVALRASSATSAAVHHAGGGAGGAGGWPVTPKGGGAGGGGRGPL